MAAKRQRQAAPAEPIDVDALDACPALGAITASEATEMLRKLSHKQQQEVLATLMQTSAAARTEVKRKFDMVATKQVDIAALQLQVKAAAQAARPKQALVKIISASEQMPAVAAFTILASMANVVTCELPLGKNRFMWESDFLYVYAQALCKAVQRMSDAELRPLAQKYEDDISVMAANVHKQDALSVYWKEVGKRGAR